MAVRTVYQVPESVAGYELNPNKGWFSVIIPEAGVNLDTNPSYELGTSGATAVNSTLAQTSLYQRRGAYGMEVTPSSAGDAGFYKTLETETGENYCFSLDLYDPGARIFWIYFADSSGNRVGRIQEIRSMGGSVGNPGWQRVWVNFSEYSGDTRRLYVIRKDTTGTPKPATSPFYVDGSLIENQSQPSIYFDGDTKGYVTGQTAFYWNGVRHASTSERIRNTGAGGTEMKLIDLGFRVMAIVGLGLAPLANVATPLSTGGAFYQQSMPQTRQFMLGGAFTATTLPELERQFDDLAGALTPERLPEHQPLTLRYHAIDDCSGDETEVIDIPCVYESGLEGGLDNYNQQRMGITFRQFLPTIYRDGEIGQRLDGIETLVDNTGVQYRDIDGKWKRNAGLVTSPYDFKIDSAGVLWAVSSSNILRWTGTAWTTFAFATGGNIHDMVFLSDGSIVAAGIFTTIEGVPVNSIAKYDPPTDTWSALGTGFTGVFVGVTSYASKMVVDSADNVYIVGNFTHSNGVLCNGIVKITGTTHTALGSGFNNIPHSIAITSTNQIYVGGGFTTAGGGAANRLAKWNGSTWSALGTGANNDINDITVDPNDNLFGIGLATTVGGVAVNYVWKYNGSTFSALGSGLNTVNGSYGDLNYLSDGGLYVSTNNYTTTAGGLTLTQPGLAIWYDDTGTWVPVETIYDTTIPFGISSAAIIDTYGRLFINNNLFHENIDYPYNTVNLVNGTPVYPVFEFTGPGVLLWVKNYTTGGYIFLDELTLVAGEQVIFNPDPYNFELRSTVKGDCRSYIRPGANSVDLYLAPGENGVAALMANTTADTDQVIRWRKTFTTLQGARR